MMGWSIYTEFITDRGKDVFLYNYLDLLYITLDRELYDIICEISLGELSLRHPDLYRTLVDNNFVVRKDIDETTRCLSLLEGKLSNDRHVCITINPTLDCNLRCWYCYETLVSGSVMSESTLDRLLKYIDGVVSSSSLESLSLSFFGGEPLLKYRKIIRPIIIFAQGVCRDKGKRLFVHFTTNGVCLVKDVVDDLCSLSIETSIQVAFDGGGEFHNKTKVFPSGKGTYDLVLSNVKYAVEMGLKMNVRCNYTVRNIDSFLDLVMDLGRHATYENVRFSFHRVWQEEETEELRVKREELKNKILPIGIKSNIFSFLGHGISYCYADYKKNYLINYNGDVFKCTARSFDPHNRIGYLDEDGNISYIGTSCDLPSLLTKDCLSCRVLPICTVCVQRRRENPSVLCLDPNFRRYASENIKKHFADKYQSCL